MFARLLLTIGLTCDVSWAQSDSERTVTSTVVEGRITPAAPPIANGPWFDPEHLEGTWSSKSMMVITGPDFYDPIDELLIEPALPGISYSFTKDGYFEQALYQVTGDGRNASCATAALTFQHGTYNITDDKKLHLYPFEDDGRQLVSDPCKDDSDYSRYVQYDQKEVYAKFEVWVDLYYGRYRLDLYQFDGTPMPPMYLVYRPPQMLPTETLNPGVKEKLKAAAEGATATGTKGSKREVAGSVKERIRRSLINRSRTNAKRETLREEVYNGIWWGGVSMIFVGAVGWIYFS